MDTLMTLLVVMIAAMPGAPAYRSAERAPQPALEKAEHKALAERRVPQQNAEECSESGARSVAACVHGRTLTRKIAVQERIRICNKEATDRQLKGYARLDFVTACLHV